MAPRPPFPRRTELLHSDLAESPPARRTANPLRRLSIRIGVAAVIIAIHVLLIVHFVPSVRIERPAFVVTEVSLGPPESAEARPAAEP